MTKTLIFDANYIDKRVSYIADRINDDYKDRSLVLIGILKGSFIFLSDLSRKLTVPHIVDFMSVSSYGHGGNQQGVVKILLDTREDLYNKDVIIVEDIIDSGKTIHYLTQIFDSKQARSIRTCSLLRRAENDLDIDYCGMTVEKTDWVVGYGMDYKEQYRTLPALYRLEM